MPEKTIEDKIFDVTRFEVIDHSASNFRGRCYTKYDAYIEASFQDGGKTLKIFVHDRPKDLK